MDAPPGPAIIATLPARHLARGERLKRGAARLFGASGIVLLVANVMLIALPLPHLHLCLFPLALILGPVLGWFAMRERVVFEGGPMQCPRCREEAVIPKNTAGWPARFNCERCGIMVELNSAV
jgi:hypothetical protein